MKIGMEEYAVVIDSLPYGKSTDVRREPIAQVVGEDYFTLLEVTPKSGTVLAVGDRIYIGKGPRDKVDHIKSRISYSDLTSSARAELERTLRRIITEKEPYFISFFNKCGPINIRLHQLELLPGVGKKHMRDILDEREKKPFESLADLNKRVALLPDAVKIISDRILEELTGKSKYYILTRPPFQKEEGQFNAQG
jgi:putative nucleotide binding protein